MKYFNYSIVFFLAIIAFSFISCSEETEGSLYDPGYIDNSKPNPEISEIQPPGGTFSGISLITISGQNFSTNSNENHVFFNGEKGEVRSSTATELLVKVPVVVSDSVLIKVRVDGAFLFADYYPYRLSRAAVDFKAIDANVNAYGLACDKEENIYLLRSDEKDIVRISHPDSGLIVYADAGVPPQCSGMKIGPDGSLFHLRKNKNIYRIPPGGGSREIFTKVGENVNDLDFSSNGTLFAGGKGEFIYSVNIDDGSTHQVADYTGYEISALRVYNNQLYVAANYAGDEIPAGWQEGIWKHDIVSDTLLGQKQDVYNWGEYAGPNGPSVLTMTFDEDGVLYLGLDKDIAVMRIDLTTGELAPLYPEILVPPIEYMVWGNGYYLYLNNRPEIAEDRKVIRVETTKMGAPYWGRK